MSGVILFIFATLISDAARSDDSFEQRRDRRLEACMEIAQDEYSTGLLFNPPGYKTFFHRAECLQKLAIDEHVGDTTPAGSVGRLQSDLYVHRRYSRF